jgi:hypothetical protein
MASQHLVMIGGISTLSLFICSARSTPNVGRPLSWTPLLPFVVGVAAVCVFSLNVGKGGNYSDICMSINVLLGIYITYETLI